MYFMPSILSLPVKYICKYKDKISDRTNGPFFIREEPNENNYCEPFNPNHKFIAQFYDHRFKLRHWYYMRGNVDKVKRDIELLDKRLWYNNNKIDDYLDMMSENPSLPVDKLEKYNHRVAEDLSSIRKLESFVMVYDNSYTRKPEYPGEERDNVNTY